MKSIIQNTQNVQAILDGRKTQFRTPIKEEVFISEDTITFDNKTQCWFISDYIKEFAPHKDGDILYVKETFCELYENGKKIIAFKNDDRFDYIDYSVKWKPSIHLKQEDARIFLKVTNVRVERLNEISNEDLKKEGLPSEIKTNHEVYCWWTTLWNSTAKDGSKWVDNPCVIVEDIERV